jgi:hypothetical protein
MACLQHHHVEQWDCYSCTKERQKGASQTGGGIPLERLCPAVERVGLLGTLVLWPITTVCAIVCPLLTLVFIWLSAVLIYWLLPALQAATTSCGIIVYVGAIVLGAVLITLPARMLLRFIPKDYGVVRTAAVQLVTLGIFLAVLHPFASQFSKSATEFQKSLQPKLHMYQVKGHTSVAKMN